MKAFLKWFFTQSVFKERFVKRCLWGGVVLILIGVALWTVANVWTTWRFDKKVEWLRARGYETSLEALAPPTKGLDQEKNAASVYKAVFALLVRPSSEEGVVYEKARQDGFSKLSVGEKEMLRRWLEKNANAFDLLSLARGRPFCRFDRDYSKGFKIDLSDVSEAIRTATFLSLKAESDADKGDTIAARGAIQYAFLVGEAYREEPIVVCQLVRLVCIALALDGVKECVTSELGEADLRAWLGELPPVDRYDRSIQLGLRGELATQAQELRDMNAEKSSLLMGFQTRSGLLQKAVWVFFAKPLLRYDAVLCLELTRKSIDRCDLPAWKAYEEMSALGEEVTDILKRPFLHPVVNLLMPAMERTIRNQVHVQANIAVLRAGLECEIAYRAGGRYPEKIEGIDPFTGTPLRYRPGEGVLYSVGSNRQDDGGKENPSNREEGDIVWKLRHHRE